MRADLCQRYPFLTETTSWRLVHAYGTLATDVLGNARTVDDLGRGFGADLTEREVNWLVQSEWARTAEDILWRRSKLGLLVNNVDVERLTYYLGSTTVASAQIVI